MNWEIHILELPDFENIILNIEVSLPHLNIVIRIQLNLKDEESNPLQNSVVKNLVCFFKMFNFYHFFFKLAPVRKLL